MNSNGMPARTRDLTITQSFRKYRRIKMKRVALNRLTSMLFCASLLIVAAQISTNASSFDFTPPNASEVAMNTFVGEYDFDLYNRTNVWSQALHKRTSLEQELAFAKLHPARFPHDWSSAARRRLRRPSKNMGRHDQAELHPRLVKSSSLSI